MEYGYVRVFTKEQNEERQLIAMREFGAKDSNTVLDMLLLGTRQGRDLTGTLISDIVLQLLSYVAQTERENIRQRQMEGIAAAKARGVHFGPEAQAPPEGFAMLHQAWRARQMTLREAAEACGMPKSTFYDAALRAEAAVGRI